MWILILTIGTIIAAFCGGVLRNELKKSEYWKELPKGAEVFGICLPIVLFIIWSDGKVSWFRIVISIVLVIFFLAIVVGQNEELKEKPLKDSGQMLPDNIRKKAIIFYVLSPFLTIVVLFAVGAAISLFLNMIDTAKKRKK